MRLPEVKNGADWDDYEGAQWLNAVKERGLRLDRLPRDIRDQIERAEARNRAALAQGAKV